MSEDSTPQYIAGARAALSGAWDLFQGLVILILGYFYTTQKEQGRMLIGYKDEGTKALNDKAGELYGAIKAVDRKREDDCVNQRELALVVEKFSLVTENTAKTLEDVKIGQKDIHKILTSYAKDMTAVKVAITKLEVGSKK